MKLLLTALLGLLYLTAVPAPLPDMGRAAVTTTHHITETVYICNGKYATKYHKTNTCSGLNNCKSTITAVDKKEAEKKGRTGCAVCYK